MAIDYSKWIYATSATPYLDSYNTTEKKLRENNNKVIEGLNTSRDEELAKSNASYDNTARQNWINYMQAQKKLPSQLNALGIRGGASESSALRLGTNYGTNVASNEAARNTALQEIRNSYAKQIADRNIELENQLTTALQTAKDNQLKWENEQKDKDLQQFSSVIEGLYKSKDSYKKLIEKLKASKDPNKEMKIMLATRAMNMLKSSGSGGSGGRSYGGRSYGGYGSSGGGGDSAPNGGVDVTAAMNKYRKDNYKKRTTTSSSTGSSKKYWNTRAVSNKILGRYK